MTTRKDTDSKILDAARALFIENGYGGTTTRAVAAKANVNEVTLFRRFGSKELLFHAVLARETKKLDSLDPLVDDGYLPPICTDPIFE